ncbi:MAG: hypothetical protein V1709_00945 [Planctomycetota bacterium]
MQLKLTQQAELILNQIGIKFVKEYRFNPPRRWRFDYAIVQKGIAVELEGAVWVRGRHTRGSGFIKDCEKYNRATILGWKILRYTNETIHNLLGDVELLIALNKE